MTRAGFDCLACTACCRLLEVRVAASDRVPPELTRETAGGTVMRRGPDGSCVALDRGTGRCRVYDRRPAACREFPAGSGSCLDAQAWLEGRRPLPG